MTSSATPRQSDQVPERGGWVHPEVLGHPL